MPFYSLHKNNAFDDGKKLAHRFIGGYGETNIKPACRKTDLKKQEGYIIKAVR